MEIDREMMPASRHAAIEPRLADEVKGILGKAVITEAKYKLHAVGRPSPENGFRVSLRDSHSAGLCRLSRLRHDAHSSRGSAQILSAKIFPIRRTSLCPALPSLLEFPFAPSRLYRPRCHSVRVLGGVCVRVDKYALMLLP